MRNRIIPNREYKDTVFRMLFSESKEDALSLYNAVNGSSYSNPEDLDFRILKDVIFMTVKNDNAFLFEDRLNLYEHQSSLNPNMPLRGFFYFSSLYKQCVPDDNALYSTTMLKIPTPKYIVFYNGLAETEDVVKLRLSDMFILQDDSKEFEWTATMININPGHNESITEKCPKLKGYIYFVERTRFYKREGLELTEALDCAVEDSIRNGYISDFLQLHRKEVLDMSITEFDEKAFEEMLREEGRKEGIEEGIKEGREQGRKEGSMELLINLYKEGIISLDVVSSQLNLSNEELTLLIKNTK